MKKMIYQLFTLLLAACLLAGCGLQRMTQQVLEPRPVEQETAMPEQQAMPQAQLQEALARTEYAMLCAAISTEATLKSMAGQYFMDIAYVGDIDCDNQLELAKADMAMYFDIDNDRDLNCQFTQNSVYFYVDAEGNFYKNSGMGDGWPEPMGDGYYHCYNYFYDSYSIWSNGEWKQVLMGSEDSVREAWDNEDGFDLRYGEYLEYNAEYEIDGQPASAEEYNAQVSKLTKVTTKSSDYTVNLYDAVYTDSLLSAMESRFGSDFGASSIRQDVDGDGELETVMVVPGLLDPYKASYERYRDELWFMEDGYASVFPAEHDHTGIVVADVQGDKLKLTAYCALTDVQLHNSTTVTYRDNCLWLGNTAVYAPERFTTLEELEDADRNSVYNGLVSFLKTGGYTQAVLKKADISDAPGSELLCLCQKDGQWYVLVIVFQNGIPSALNSINLDSSAVYLTEIEGKQAILTYNQFIFTSTDGYSRTNYYYSVYRYDQNGQYVDMGGDSVGYSDDDQDATEVAEFFQKLNGYLVKIIVISDPFQLQGSQWLAPEQADYGTTPQEPEPEQAEESVMGFVQINDPSSWLNLREGPGTDYPCILMDPNNPDSFVRQALGSPVTVLETIETGDAENPVWLRIRITYANKIIEGYSSKRYIRLAE